MEGFWKNIRTVTPYTPGEQPKEEHIIKLNTNENPYPPSLKVMEALKSVNRLRFYPDPQVSSLVKAIACYHGLSEEQVFVGVGSDDVLAMCFMTFFNGTLPLLFPDVTYSFYDVWAELFRIPYECVPLKEDFSIDPKDYVRPNGGIVFPNPNAPTGLYLELTAIEEILKNNRDVIVIVDEAYIDFGGMSAETLLDRYPNLIVVRTFSKSRSMAGMRIGYALGSRELIRAINDVKYSYNSYTMNEPSILAGAASIEDDDYFKKTCQKIIDTREWFKVEMKQLGFHFPDSMANFLFAAHESVAAREIFEAAKKEHIYVRYFNNPRIDNYLRITIGTREEMERLLDFLKNFLNKK